MPPATAAPWLLHRRVKVSSLPHLSQGRLYLRYLGLDLFNLLLLRFYDLEHLWQDFFR
jgi:hypothetical protein